ncbi:MAG TPA: 8-oxo-dGTP diphosphatase MutT [Tenericutes bacterium]|nr:8-oxo-dGTP diphosphatase MutT [Mycoplasmatota bacterium]
MKKIEVAAAVIRNNDEIFCAQRKNEGPLAKKWEFPGGKVEIGESPKEALRRELYEELNLDIEIKDYIMTVEHQYPTFFITMHAYYCDVENRDIILNEHLDSKWLDKEKLDTLDWAEADIPIVEKIKTLAGNKSR